MNNTVQTRLGLIAGEGRYPQMVLAGVKRAGCHVTVIGLRGFAACSLLMGKTSLVTKAGRTDSSGEATFFPAKSHES